VKLVLLHERASGFDWVWRVSALSSIATMKLDKEITIVIVSCQNVGTIADRKTKSGEARCN